ncbi:hypothetical protein G5B40_02890 [Pikeienuella piscinae]|uniref:ABM domain-containing protein n=1 Tax=Pikeienuella piscinae TaxID=2748098 RepID=A0A7L5BX52_9RHOB|nr:antibiotic biosynthesis monooxygenase [Pikeienuella piscinae]QIE54474.1 hypothetical protein G5B40_02890 [Pikeienuella piscinae]
MHTVLARWFVKPGQMNAARAALRKLARDVRESEPGTLIYLIHEAAQGSLPPAGENEIVFFEGYRDEGAFKAHISGPVYTAFLKEHGDLFVQNFPPNSGPYMLVATLASVGGFTRNGHG